FASPGIGTSPHLTGEMLWLASSVKVVHVPYPGLAPAMTDLVAGHVDVLIDNLGNSLPMIRDGKVRALGVANEARIPELHDVPAIAETFPGFYSASWFAMVAPPKTAPGIAAKVSQAIAETLKLPDVAKRFSDLSIRPVGTTPEETAEFLKQETERWRNVIVTGGIKTERPPNPFASAPLRCLPPPPRRRRSPKPAILIAQSRSSCRSLPAGPPTCCRASSATSSRRAGASRSSSRIARVAVS